MAWQNGPLPIKEPHLEELVNKTRNVNLFFTTDFKTSIEEADLIFICVGTPTKQIGFGAGKATLVEYVETAARTIGHYAVKSTIVIEKSTVPVGISRSIRIVLNANSNQGASFQILSNPEFSSEGTAIYNLQNPDRILIGHELTPEGIEAARLLSKVYEHWVAPEKILTVNVWSSELSKLTANAFLAQRVSSINCISAICEKTGANVDEVAHAIGLDTRIGDKYLKASVGFGGSWSQKDVLNLVYIAESLGLNQVASYWQGVIKINNWQRERYVRDIVHTLFDTLQNKKIALFGFSYKADTGDTRESSAISVTSMLMKENARIYIYDPQVSSDQIVQDLLGADTDLTPEIISKKVTILHEPYECVSGAHALLILTEWPIFKEYDYQVIYESMIKPAFVFDGRNILDREKLKKIGFCTHGIGVPPDFI